MVTAVIVIRGTRAEVTEIVVAAEDANDKQLKHDRKTAAKLTIFD